MHITKEVNKSPEGLRCALCPPNPVGCHWQHDKSDNRRIPGKDNGKIHFVVDFLR